MATIGIDFGSSYTTVSWINPRYGKPDTIKFNGDGSIKYPSVIMGTDSGLILGNQALTYLEGVYKLPANERFDVMNNFIPSIKRTLSPQTIEIIGGHKYSHAQLLTEFFSQIRQLANAHGGSDIDFDSAVISHPVDFPQANIQLLEQALHDAGFKHVSMKLEPIAAVQGYGIDHNIPEGTGILVFDFGGGTIDVAYIRKYLGNLKLLCEPKGDKTCGGQDFDFLLYEDLRKRLLSTYNMDISASNMIDYEMLNSCRKLKEHFSGPNDVYEIPIVFAKDNRLVTYKYHLNRETFNNIIHQKAADAVNVARAVIEQTRQKNFSIDKVLLIGGSSQLTLIRKMLTDILPDATIDTCGEKDVAVALGNIAEEQVAGDKPDKTDEAPASEVKDSVPPQGPQVIYVHNDKGEMHIEW